MPLSASIIRTLSDLFTFHSLLFGIHLHFGAHFFWSLFDPTFLYFLTMFFFSSIANCSATAELDFCATFACFFHSPYEKLSGRANKQLIKRIKRISTDIYIFSQMRNQTNNVPFIQQTLKYSTKTYAFLFDVGTGGTCYFWAQVLDKRYMMRDKR